MGMEYYKTKYFIFQKWTQTTFKYATIFERDLNDSMYKVQNVKNFYYHDGSIYIVFAYGNEKATNEVDIAVI